MTHDGRFQRVGSNKELQTNVRIFAATNRNLEKEVEAGGFREDFFYRLNVVEIFIPPLRERREDIVPLATCFAKEFVKGDSGSRRPLSARSRIPLAWERARIAQCHGTRRAACRTAN